MYCKTCGQSNSDWSNYCSHDGTSLVNSSVNISLKHTNKETNFCPKCGEKANLADNYCMGCGQSLLKMSKVEETKIPVFENTKVISSQSFSLAFVVNILKKSLVPVIISFSLMLIFTYMLTTFTNKTYHEFLEEAFGVTPESLMSELPEEIKSYVEAPDQLIGYTDMIMGSHLISPSYELDLIMNMYEERLKVTGELDINWQNILYLLIPIITLFIGGIIYRKRNPEISIRSFLSGAIGIGFIYSLVLTIFSLFSGFNYDFNFSYEGDSVSFKVDTIYPFFTTFLKGMLMGTVFSIIGMLFSINYRQTTKQLDSLMPFGEAIHQGVATFVRGFVILLITIIIILGAKVKDLKDDLEWLGSSFLNEIFEKSAFAVISLGAELSALIYSMIHFSPLSFKFKHSEGGFMEGTGSVDYSIFSGFSFHGAAEEELPKLDYFFSVYDIEVYLKLAIFIPIILSILAGYRIAKSNQSNFKSLAIFSLVYSILTAILASAGSLGVAGDMRMLGEGTVSMSISLTVSDFKVFMGSFILSYIAGFVGSYLNQFISRTSK